MKIWVMFVNAVIVYVMRHERGGDLVEKGGVGWVVHGLEQRNGVFQSISDDGWALKSSIINFLVRKVSLIDPLIIALEFPVRRNL
jgi:hypothetical protein